MNKIATIQMCSTDHLNDNLNTAAALVEKAAKRGALLAVLPEMFVLFEKDPLAKIKIKETAGSGKMQDFLAQLARRNKIWIVAGTLPLEALDPNKVRAACLVFDANGKQVARFDKIHLFDVRISDEEVYKESDSIEPGHQISLVNTPLGKLGLCVCFDLRFPDLFSQLSALGVELIAVPAAFTLTTGLAHWKLLCRSRAIDTLSYVIGACQGGKHANGRSTFGHSMIVNPWGEVIKEIKRAGNGVAIATIDLQALQAIRQKIPLGSVDNCSTTRTTPKFPGLSAESIDPADRPGK